MAGQKVGQTLLHKTLPANAGGPSKLAFKRDKEYDVSLIKNQCITVNMQKNQLNLNSYLSRYNRI